MNYSDLKSLYESVVLVRESPADKCPEGQYFCNDEQKCKPIPSGHKVMADGELIKEWTFDDDFDIILESYTSPSEVKRIATKDLVSTYLWLIKGMGQRLYKDEKDPEWQKAADVLKNEMQIRAKAGDEAAQKAIVSKGPSIVGTANKVPVLKSTIASKVQKKPSAMKALIKKILGRNR